MKKIKLKVPKLKSKFVYDKKIARRFMNMDYYKAQNIYTKKYAFIEAEKRRLSTPHWSYVSKLLSDYKSLGQSGYQSSTGKTLNGIYQKNIKAVKLGMPVRNEKLLKLVAKPELLLLAYREIRGNKGSLTPAAMKSTQDINNMNPEQREIYFKSNIFPDGFSIQDIILTSRLLRKGLYPWGASSRIYIDKPGVKNKKRPITIPPFLDKVVQKSIELVLQSIYEPVFEARNRSFGFRPNKGVHDAIVAITCRKTNGMRVAIEGDIEAAYDTVDREKLLKILSKRTHDDKFLRLIRQRLDYEYVEKESNQRFKPNLGIPQGGVDSPYLFNIYMHELDEFVHTEIQDTIGKMNIKAYGSPTKEGTYRRTVNKGFLKIKNAVHTKIATLANLKKKIKKADEAGESDKLSKLRNELFSRISDIRLLRYKARRLSSTDKTKVEIRFFYVRYADDWILLTNGSKAVAELIKSKISDFLLNELKLKLSPSKTLITDIIKEPAHFLGFEIRGQDKGPLRRTLAKGKNHANPKHKWTLSRVSGLLTWTAPDRQRLISRLHMKGYCKADGFPIGIPMLTTVEPHVIVERYNAIIRGLANHYLNFIRNHSSLSRWIYIIRYSCFKTLAHKYRTSITGIFKRFGRYVNIASKKTVNIQVVLKLKKKSYTKDWTLLTYKDVLKIADKRNRFISLEKTFWDIEKGRRIGEYPLGRGRVAKVTNDDYLDAISWVN
jgi:retron-type reverse transcriptase